MAASNSRALYTSEELLAGLELDDPLGFASTFDFLTFREFIAAGGPTPKTLRTRSDQALHDAAIADALRRHVATDRPRLVGVMGGHKVSRRDDAYEAIVHLSRAITREGHTIVTGGGPGAMEAAHVGAYFALSTDEELAKAIGDLRQADELPNLSKVLLDDGRINPAREPELRKAHLWLKAALSAKARLSGSPGISLAIPTWRYGQEPTMPFATRYAKYFLNSLREEALVTEATLGIIYARGGGGTIREIFQDVEENYYAASAEAFTPMVFFDPDDYWSDNRVGIRLDTTLNRVFRVSRKGKGDAEARLEKVVFTTDVVRIVALLGAQAPEQQRKQRALLANDPMQLEAATWNRA